MKTILSTLAIVALACTSFGQIKEGKISFDMKFSSADPMIQQQAAMMQGSKMVQYFAAEGTRTEMNMGMFVNTTVIKNIKDKKTLQLNGGMMGNKAILTDDLVKAQDSQNENVAEKTTETKKILGLLCTKYIIDLGPESGMVMIWTTEEIKPEVKLENQFSGGNVQGVPMLIEVENPQMSITITATDIVKDLKKENKKKLFSTEIPEGYEVTTMEQMMQEFGEE